MKEEERKRALADRNKSGDAAPKKEDEAPKLEMPKPKLPHSQNRY